MKLEGVTKGNKHLGEPLEDYVAGMAITENGLHVPFSLRWTNHEEEDYVFSITGAKGTLKVEGFRKCTLTQGSNEIVLYQHDLSQSFRNRHKPGIKAELERFVGYLNGEHQESLLPEALNAQRAVELLYR